MEYEELKKKVDSDILHYAEIEDREIRREDNLFNDLGFDSLDQIELLMSLEVTFDIEIPDEDVDDIRTAGSIYDYVQNALKE